MEYKAWMNAAEYKWLMMAREFDQEGLWQHEGICSCAHWLNWKCGIGMNAAREKVRVANVLVGLPKLSARYAKDEISYSKARAISRIATPENEDYLLMIARHGTAAHVEGLVRKYRRCKRLQDRRNAREQHAGRELKAFYDDDGSLVIQGRFPPEEGTLVLNALKLAMDRRDKEVEAEHAADRGPGRHGLHFGYVLRGSVDGVAMSIGEGWARAQKVPVLSGYLNDVWIQQNQVNIDNAR